MVLFSKIWLFNRLYLSLWQVQACGSLVTEEHPYAMVVPIELFLMGFGFCRIPYFATSSSNGSNPTSPSSRSCIAPELLSPESLGIKLKPIKTRADIALWPKKEISTSSKPFQYITFCQCHSTKGSRTSTFSRIYIYIYNYMFI